MPIFEYRCKSCKRIYESLIMSSRGEKDRSCPYCGSRKGERLVSAVSLVRSPSQKHRDRMQALSKVDPAKPQEVARHLKKHGSFRGDGLQRNKGLEGGG